MFYMTNKKNLVNTVFLKVEHDNILEWGVGIFHRKNLKGG